MIFRYGERKFGSISSKAALELSLKKNISSSCTNISFERILLINNYKFCLSVCLPACLPFSLFFLAHFFGFGGSFCLITGAKFSGTDHLSFGKYWYTPTGKCDRRLSGVFIQLSYPTFVFHSCVNSYVFVPTSVNEDDV